jgi:hypothetical protein
MISSLLVKKSRNKNENNEGHFAVDNSKSIEVMPINKTPIKSTSKRHNLERTEKQRLKMKTLINSHYTSIKREENDHSPEDH